MNYKRKLNQVLMMLLKNIGDGKTKRGKGDGLMSAEGAIYLGAILGHALPRNFKN